MTKKRGNIGVKYQFPKVFQVAKSILEEAHLTPSLLLKQDCLTMPPWGNSC